MNKRTDTSQKVMDRIMNENRWALPVHKHEEKSSKRLRKFSMFIAILILMGISVSFIFIRPQAADITKPAADEEKIIATVKATDFAKIFSNLDFLVIKESTVASIGVPKIYQPKEKGINKGQLFWMLSIFGISLVTLFMSWLSRENNNDKENVSNRT